MCAGMCVCGRGGGEGEWNREGRDGELGRREVRRSVPVDDSGLTALEAHQNGEKDSDKE